MSTGHSMCVECTDCSMGKFSRRRSIEKLSQTTNTFYQFNHLPQKSTNYSSLFSIDGIFLQARYLPTPLNEIHELFPLITAYDCFTLLSNIWNYLKQNQQLLTNRSQQQSIARDSLFYDPIRYVIQKNIADLGHIAKHFLHFQLQTTLSIT